MLPIYRQMSANILPKTDSKEAQVRALREARVSSVRPKRSLLCPPINQIQKASEPLVSAETAGAQPSPLKSTPAATTECIAITVAKRGRPRLEDRQTTLKVTKPWEKLLMSERTWYRRKKLK